MFYIIVNHQLWNEDEIREEIQIAEGYNVEVDYDTSQKVKALKVKYSCDDKNRLLKYLRKIGINVKSGEKLEHYIKEIENSESSILSDLDQIV